MKNLLIIYLTSVLVITSSFMNAQVHDVKLNSNDYFFALVPGINTLMAALVIKISIDNIIKIETNVISKTLSELDEKYDKDTK